MTGDEIIRVADAMADFPDLFDVGSSTPVPKAFLVSAVVRQLEAAGFRMFRPDDCGVIRRCVDHAEPNALRGMGCNFGTCEHRDYWLVPVEETT